MSLFSIHRLHLLGLGLLGLVTSAVPAAELWQTLPRSDRAVHDFAQQLDPRAESQLESFLTATFRSLDTPIVVVTLPSLEGGQIDDFANRLYEHWGIGTRPDNRGILFLIALEERQMRIETGYGTEPIITDTLAASLIRDVARPRFRQGDVAGGIEAVCRFLAGTIADAEGKTIEGAAAYSAKASDRGGSGGLANLVLWIIILISVFSGAGRRSRHLRHRSMLPLLLMSGGFRGSSRGGFGSSGSGGFGGFGGGFSGGGGASGGW